MQQEQKKRELPVIEIVPGVEFYVDALKQLLIDTKDSTNTISPLEMLPLEDHYECVFDRQARNLKQGSWWGTEGKRYEYIWIRPLEVYDYEGAKILLSGKEVFPKNLPVVDIEHVKFLWDRSRTRLLQQDNPFNQILKCSFSLRSVEPGIYFDTVRKFVSFPHEIERQQVDGPLPSHIRFVPTSEINEKIKQAENPVKQAVSKGKGMRTKR